VLICLLIYLPGLWGSFLFDDLPNIVANPDVKVGDHPHWADWMHAAWSAHTDLKRPLAMLSFALNIYFTGLWPLPMKLVNLFIHLGNGLLLYGVAFEILRLNQRRCGLAEDPAMQRHAAALLVAAWLLLPINVSGVLYVVQRMESMAQLFVLAGLWVYLRMRAAESRLPRPAWQAFAALIPFTAAGLLAKETAVLLPLYALLLEISLLRFESRSPRGFMAMYIALVVVPGVLAGFWLYRHYFNPAQYAERLFTPNQRLLTEAHVLCDYLVWILLPAPDTLSFYHDQYPVSQGLLSPPITLLYFLALGALLLIAAGQRNRRPLVSLGILWFFAAHLLTATFVTLELVFEHRNYFASIGVLLAVSGLLLPLQRSEPRAAALIVAAGLALYSFLTAVRTQDWGDPLQLAYAEVDAHPHSPRANYELGRMLVIASNYKIDSPFMPKAITTLEHAGALPDSSILPISALILVANRSHQPVQPRWWAALTAKLKSQPAGIEDVTALQDLASCQLRKDDCVVQVPETLRAFEAAMTTTRPSSILLMTYGDYVAEHGGDLAFAEQMVRRALDQSPSEAEMQMDLLKYLRLEGKFEEGEPLAARLKTENLTPEQVDKLVRILQLTPQSTAR
jgi:hypothetical protein